MCILDPMSSFTTFKTRTTPITRNEIWAITVDLLEPNPHPDDLAPNDARAAIEDAWSETKTTLTLSGLSPSQLSFMADELEYFGDTSTGWAAEVMASRRAFPRIAREIRALLAQSV